MNLSLLLLLRLLLVFVMLNKETVLSLTQEGKVFVIVGIFYPEVDDMQSILVPAQVGAGAA